MMINRFPGAAALAACILSSAVFGQAPPERPREAGPPEQRRADEVQRRTAEDERRRAEEAVREQRIVRERPMPQGGPGSPGPEGGPARSGPGQTLGMPGRPGGPGQLDAMRNYLDTVDRYTRLANDPVSTGVAAVVTAGELARARGTDVAIEFFNTLLTETRNSTIQRAIRLQLMELHKSRGQQEQALNQLRELIKSVPERPEPSSGDVIRLRMPGRGGAPGRTGQPGPQPPAPARIAPPAPRVPPPATEARPRAEEEQRERAREQVEQAEQRLREARERLEQRAREDRERGEQRERELRERRERQ